MFRLTSRLPSAQPHDESSDVRELAAWVAVTVACGAVVVGLVPHHGTPPSPVDAAAVLPAAPRTSASPSSSSASPSATAEASIEQVQSAPVVAADPLASLFPRSLVAPSTTTGSAGSRTPARSVAAAVTLVTRGMPQPTVVNPNPTTTANAPT